jgi:RNase adaptor protein for sRNA GlmZ degradation
MVTTVVGVVIRPQATASVELEQAGEMAEIQRHQERRHKHPQAEEPESLKAGVTHHRELLEMAEMVKQTIIQE